jgi:hypothetical protein
MMKDHHLNEMLEYVKEPNDRLIEKYSARKPKDKSQNGSDSGSQSAERIGQRSLPAKGYQITRKNH